MILSRARGRGGERGDARSFDTTSIAARPLQAILRANNVPFAVTEGDRVLVSPETTGGLLIEFMPQN